MQHFKGWRCKRLQALMALHALLLSTFKLANVQQPARWEKLPAASQTSISAETAAGRGHCSHWCRRRGQAAASSKPCTAACAALRSWSLSTLLLAGQASGATCGSKCRLLLCCCWRRHLLSRPAKPVQRQEGPAHRHPHLQPHLLQQCTFPAWCWWVAPSSFGSQELERSVLSQQQTYGPGADPHDADQQATESSTDLERLVQCVLDWLADSSVMQQLETAGYGVQQLPAKLRALLAANAAARRSLDGEGCIEKAIVGLQAELEAAGAALTALATPAFCNNPACENVSGPTELSLVSGRSCLCGRCRVARTCSRACQRAQWAQHKRVCKVLEAAGPALQQQQQLAV